MMFTIIMRQNRLYIDLYITGSGITIIKLKDCKSFLHDMYY